MTVELSRHHNDITPLENDLKCRTLALSLGDPIDEAAASAKKYQQEERQNAICESPRSVFISSAQMDAYHPMEDKIYLNEREKLYAIFDGHGGGIPFIFLLLACMFLCLYGIYFDNC